MKHRRGSEHIEGISLEKDGYKFKGSEIDRRFSYAGLRQLFKACATPKLLGVKLTPTQWRTPKFATKELVDSAAGIASALFGAIDPPNPDYNPDESEFERQERIKKKKKRGQKR